MRRLAWGIVCWCAAISLAQAQSLPAVPDSSIAPVLKILKGELIEWNVRGLSGDLLMEVTEGPRRWRCQVTADTFLSRSSIRIHPAGVRAGDTLEIVAEGRPAECLARTIYITAPDPRRLRARQPWLAVSNMVEGLAPRGLLTFTGIVNRVEGNRLYLQTRKFGAKSFILHEDAVFSNRGRSVEASTLGAQTRVFVRANRTYDGDLEVYHVVWGDILLTRDGH